MGADTTFMSSVGSRTKNAAIITGTDPAANTEISEVVPAGQAWELLAVTFSLVKATAAGRVSLLLDNGTSVFAKIPTLVDAPVATTQFSFIADLPYAMTAVADTSIVTGMPKLILPAGYRIRTTRTAGDAGDNYTAPVIFVGRLM